MFPVAKKMVFTRQNSFLRWVGQKYFFALWEPPLGRGTTFRPLQKDWEIQRSGAHFRAFSALLAIVRPFLATFPPVRQEGFSFLQGFSSRSPRIPGPESGPAGPTFCRGPRKTISDPEKGGTGETKNEFCGHRGPPRGGQRPS